MQGLLDPQITNILVTLLIMLSVAGVTFIVITPLLNRDSLKKRKKSVTTQNAATTSKSGAKQDGAARRKSVQDQLKALEQKQAADKKTTKRLSFADRMVQSGLNWSRPKYLMFSIVSGMGFFLLARFWEQGLLISAALFFVGMFGFPRWYVSRRRKKRFNKFLEEFPTAIDIIVRGVKSGMPLGDCFQVAAREAKDPVGPELRFILEKMHMGLSLPDALGHLIKRVPLPEANFLAIVIAIQSQAGGSLAEALGNLSKTLRQRKAMKGKIRAYSQEAKTSAAIIGSLPFLVSGGMLMIAPDYMRLLYDTSIGVFLLIGCGLWMSIGVLIMHKMIDFKI